MCACLRVCFQCIDHVFPSFFLSFFPSFRPSCRPSPATLTTCRLVFLPVQLKGLLLSSHNAPQSGGIRFHPGIKQDCSTPGTMWMKLGLYPGDPVSVIQWEEIQEDFIQIKYNKQRTWVGLPMKQVRTRRTTAGSPLLSLLWIPQQPLRNPWLHMAGCQQSHSGFLRLLVVDWKWRHKERLGVSVHLSSSWNGSNSNLPVCHLLTQHCFQASTQSTLESLLWWDLLFAGLL